LQIRAAHGHQAGQGPFAYSSESVTNQGSGWLFVGGADTGWFESFLDRLAAVTVDDVGRVAETYLARRNRTVGHYVPQGA
jgi:predicted Zn-dependent peptidase